MKQRVVAAVAGLGGLLLVASLVLGWYGFPALVIQQITYGVGLRNGSEAHERWQKLPQPLQFKVYVMNVTNAEGIYRRQRPVLQELGPYYYDEYREKIVVRDHPEDDTVSYKQKSTFLFNPEKSGGRSEDDVVTVLNVALLGTAIRIKNSLAFALPIMNSVVPEIFPNSSSIFLTTTVRQLLFDGVIVIDCRSSDLSSMATLVCLQADGQLPTTVRKVPEEGVYKFSLLHHKNGSSDGTYRVHRGLSSVADLGRIVQWNEKKTLSTWKGQPCNAINGTDSTIFPPFLTTEDRIYIFVSDVCRSMYADFEKHVTIGGVPAQRYVSSRHLLDSGDDYGENKCYCNNKCLKDGAMDLSVCMQAPVIMTFPHFYLADPKYQNYPIGLRSRKELHQTFIDIEAQSGTPMRGAKRMQLNMFLQEIPELDMLQNVSEGLFPLLWMEEGLELEPENLALVQNMHSKLVTLDIVKWILLAVSVGVVLIAVSMYVILRHSCCGHGLSRRVTVSTTALTSKQVSISTLDTILHGDSAIPVQTFPPPVDVPTKRPT